MPAAGAVVDLALERGGVIDLVQLRLLGVADVRPLLRSGVLRRVAPSVFVLGSSPITGEQRVRIALAQAGPLAVVSHMSAAGRWQFPRVAFGAVEVTVPHACRPRLVVGRAHRSRRPPDPSTEVRLVDGLPTTSAARTLLDVAARLGPAHLDECLQDLCRREVVSLGEVRSCFERWRGRGRRGATRLDRLLEVAVALPQSESWLEAAFLRLLVDAGIELPETQVPIEVDGRRYRVDCLWRSLGLVVELNGYGTHATRHEIGRDAERSDRLTAAGFTVVAFTYDQVVGAPRFVEARVRVHLDRLAHVR